MEAQLSEYRRVLPYLTPHRWSLAYIVLFVVIVLTSLYLYAVNRRNREVS